MNFRSPRQSTACLIALSLGIAASAVLPQMLRLTEPAVAQTNTNFSDTQNYWGRPFIQVLAERNIVAGYLDNTFRPDQPMARDEFAAIVRKAFSLPAERQISSGSVYKDVPEGYWAEPAIQEAYEMGFVSGYPNGEFRPNQAITKVDVLSSLAYNLNLPTAPVSSSPQTTGEANQPATAAAPAASAPAATAPAATPAVTPAVTQSQPVNRRRARRPLLFPLGMTALMQPFVTSSARAAAPVAQTAPSPAPATAAVPSPTAAPETAVAQTGTVNLNSYYDDAAQIPQEAADEVAQATAAGIIVNYPDRRLLNPNQPATRGEVAALVHQALVHQGSLELLPESAEVNSYIVGR